MSRLTYVQIAGKYYPMSFSLGASKKIAGMKGGTKKLDEFMKSEGNDDEKIEVTMDILELLIAQGCAYKNYFEKDMPVPENAPVENGRWIPITKEGMQIAIMAGDMEYIGRKIKECIEKSQGKKVEAKAKGKNVQATQK